MSKTDERSKNDKAWEKLFDKFDILQNISHKGFFEITSTEINQFREARLMTKFDHRVNLPKLFADNHLAILPVTRGSYIIAPVEAYKDFEVRDNRIHKASFPAHIDSLNHENINSEAMAIHCAYASGVLADFLQDEGLLPTVSGRMSSGTFHFNIRNSLTKAFIPIQVENSQIEIDGGYEGYESLCLIEAKNYLSDDFLVRQLYYPFRLWTGNTGKKVKPIFLVFSNGIFSFYEYVFEDHHNYNSLVLIRHRNYSIDDVSISLDDILNVLNRVKHMEEPPVPFPQADSFDRVINLCELLAQNDMTRDQITMEYAFNARQTNYYSDAGRYLGLIDKKHEAESPVFTLTDEGRKILHLKYRPRQLMFVELILKHTVFRDILKKVLQHDGKIPPKGEIVYNMKQCDLFNVNADSTYERRASTVASWMKWILDLQR